ncbi:chlorohydrolase [Streptococcus pneumoniae]|nr:chlorohydrolase [Streptococcus pneumoniae]
MTQYPFFYFENSNSMKIKEQARKLAEVAQNTVLRLWIRTGRSQLNLYGKAKLMRFEEIFEEY